MAEAFSNKTFKYFELARKNKNKKEWFEKNKSLYIDHVKEPFSVLAGQIAKNFSKDLPEITIDPKKISRPLYASNKITDEGVVKYQASIHYAQKLTSQFEWNPGIYLQLGMMSKLRSDDNIFAVGLYMVSSRQMSLLRNAYSENFDEIDEILNEKKLLKNWGKMAGETFKRFPKGYSEDSEAAKYLRLKQCYLSQHLTQKQVTDKNFNKKIIQDLAVAMPFLKWVRKTVGTY